MTQGTIPAIQMMNTLPGIDTEPEDGQGNPGNGGNGTNQFKNRPGKAFHDGKPPHGKSQGNPHQKGQNVTGECLLNTGPHVGCEKRAVRVHLSPLGNEQLQDLQGRRQKRAGHHPEGEKGLPDPEKCDDTYDWKNHHQWLFGNLHLFETHG